MSNIASLAISRYELRPIAHGTPGRHGALVRFSLKDGSSGYADCHPWPELGDEPLDEQIESLRSRRWTKLLDQSMLLAFIDAEARREERSLFSGLDVPPSHLSLPNAACMDRSDIAGRLYQAHNAGFSRVKVKAGEKPDRDTGWLAELGKVCQALGLLVRLDLNEKLDFEAACVLLDKVRVATDGLAWIDWVEDPCPFDIRFWANIGARFGVRRACDRSKGRSERIAARSSDVLIYKSAVDRALDFSDLVRAADRPVCYTSYLDHPVGQAFAAYSAAANIVGSKTVETCGLLTHDVYQPNAFSERLKTNGPVLIPPEGSGIGFDDLLENLTWEELK